MHRSFAAAALLLTTSDCAQLPQTNTVAIPLLRAGEARLWIYRSDGPYEPEATPYIRLNGQVVGTAWQSGAIYRDVAPGHYSITLDPSATDVNQFTDIDLTVGEQAYAKILSLRCWQGGAFEPCLDAFYVRLMPPETALSEIAHNPFYGS